MTTVLNIPWIVLLVLTPLTGAMLVRFRALHHVARRIGIWTANVTLGLSTSLLLEATGWGRDAKLIDPLDPFRLCGWTPLWTVDALSVLLLPYAALIAWAVILLTPRAERGSASLSRALVSLACLLALFASRAPWAIVLFYLAGILPAVWPAPDENQASISRTRRFILYTIGSGVLLAFGVLLLTWYEWRRSGAVGLSIAACAILMAVMARKGLVPLHAWLPAFFQRGSYRLALIYNMPQAGIYLAARLFLPYAPDGWLTALVVIALVTAVYAAGLALVQDEARRMFGYFFMSQSSLVLAGIQAEHLVGLTASLTLWLSSGLALTGLGLTLWALEARRGPLSLLRYHGGYEQTPTLAVCFIVLGLTSVGFPGTLGFIGQEMLVDAALQARSFGSLAIMTVIVLNGVTLLRTYFVLFCGAPCDTTATQQLRLREKVGMLTLALLLLLGGLYPQPIARCNATAAEQILAERKSAQNGSAQKPPLYPLPVDPGDALPRSLAHSD